MADLTIEDYYKQLNLDPLTIEIYNKLRQDVLNDVWIYFGWRTLSVKSESAGGNKQEKLLKILKKGQEGIDAINESIVEVKPQYGGFVGTKREKDKGIVDPKGWVKHIKSLTTKTIKFKPQEIVDKSKEILEDKIAGGSVKQVTEFIEDDSDTEIFVLEEKPLDKAPENIWDDLEGYKIENKILNKVIDDIDLLREGDNDRTLLSFTNKYGAENMYQWQVGKPIYEQVDPEYPEQQGLVGYDRVGFEEILRDIEKNIRENIEEGSSDNDLEDLLHEKYLVLQNKDLLENQPDNIVKSKDDLIEGFVIRAMVFGEYDDKLDKIYKSGDYEETYNVDFDLTKQQKKELEASKNPNSIFYRKGKNIRMEDYLQKPYHNLSKEKLAVYLKTTDLNHPLSSGARSFGVGPYDWKNHKGPEDISAYNRKRQDARYELGIRGIRSGNEYWKQTDYNPEKFANPLLKIPRPGKWIYYDEPIFYARTGDLYQKLWVWDDGGGRVAPKKIKDSDSDSDEEDEKLFLLSSSDSDSLSEDSEEEEEEEEDLPSNLIESKTISSIELLEEGKEKPINLIESEIIVSKEEIKMVTYTTSKGKSHTVPYDPLFDGVFTSSSEEEEEEEEEEDLVDILSDSDSDLSDDDGVTYDYVKIGGKFKSIPKSLDKQSEKGKAFLTQKVNTNKFDSVSQIVQMIEKTLPKPFL